MSLNGTLEAETAHPFSNTVTPSRTPMRGAFSSAPSGMQALTKRAPLPAPSFANLLELSLLETNLMIKTGFTTQAQPLPTESSFDTQLVMSRDTGKQLLMALADLFGCDVAPRAPQQAQRPTPQVHSQTRSSAPARAQTIPAVAIPISPMPKPQPAPAATERQATVQPKRSLFFEAPLLLQPREPRQSWEKTIVADSEPVNENGQPTRQGQRPLYFNGTEGEILRQTRQTQAILDSLIAQSGLEQTL